MARNAKTAEKSLVGQNGHDDQNAQKGQNGQIDQN